MLETVATFAVPIVLGLIVYWIIGARKMRRMNNDQKQQALALMFVSAGDVPPEDAAKAAAEIETYIKDQGWSSVEAVDRIAHAMSMVKAMVPDDVHRNVLAFYRQHIV